MSQLYSTKRVLKTLFSFGFYSISQNGSHIKLKNKKGRIVIVPAERKVIFIGTFKKILKQAGLTQKQFDDAFRKNVSTG